ncbi:CHC2 zinc finger domain-containing protein [Nocardia ninae]|uniref:Zinc finger CHC2-type domain-containing protein n=1 Tax=Nocardia ninae NBRC 108245 TaxID=1210091 RepID=A0A511MJU3_9NOCA|nr:hypothetical protein NN4_54020 [Nocardia ninae NBRC 108245]
MAAIVSAIQRYYPDWIPPEDRQTYNKCLCPFHGESRPSASISFEHNRFNCFACGASGDAIDIIRHQEEGISFAEAKRLAADLSPGRDDSVRESVPRQPSRRVFGQPRTNDLGTTGARPATPGIRSRTAPWS